MSRSMAVLAWLQRFFASWRFPALVLSVLLSFKLLVLAVLLVPRSNDALGAFAEQFKVWCFGYDPATGRMESAYVGLTVAEPLVLGAIIAAIWWRPLAQIVRTRPRALLPYIGSAAVIVGVAAALLVASSKDARAEQAPFPAAALRTSFVPPDFDLTDQDGARVSPADLRGRVVVLTGVYASCGYACPMILAEAKRALAALTPPERADVTVVGVTLDPEHDGQEQLAGMAIAQGIASPTFHLVGGRPEAVNAALDALSIARTRDPKTGVIDHASVFVLLDRGGRVAYRFSLGDKQETWLVAALRALLAEAPR